jgi:hypothetical protein
MSQLYVDNIKNRTGGSVGFPTGIVVTGVATATQFSGNITGTTATFSGNVSVGGTLSYEDVTNVDSVGLITARNGIDVTAGGINAVGVVSATSFVGTALSISGIGTISDLSIKAAAETVSVASTSDLGGGKVVIECDATNGTVFTHNLVNGTVGIVSLKNFPVRGNSVTTYSIIFNQLPTTPAGAGNTTPATGIGTNITLTPSGVSGFTTSARVATASTVTLSTTANDVDIVTLAVHYNGSGTGTPGNYRVFATGNTGYRFGTIGF